MDFDEAFKILIGHEGGYVNDPRDPGGETKFGISKWSYPAVDIKGLTVDQAKRIYERDYWIPAGCDRVPAAIRFDLFDAAVNSGIERAVTWLQMAAGATPDGKLGPKTLTACIMVGGPTLQARFNGHRLEFMTNLSTWNRFGRGWARRIASNLQRAV